MRLMLVAFALFATMAAATDRITPTSEAELDSRVGQLQKEAREAPCQAEDRICALAKLSLASSATELARGYTKCAQYGGDQPACEERAKARLAAARAFEQSIKEAFKKDTLFREDVPEQSPALAAYADRVRADLDASHCHPEGRLCIVGTLAALVEIDQALRHAASVCKGSRGSPEWQECSKPYFQATVQADQRSTAYLVDLTNKIGWPDAVKWGITTQDHAWLLAQHADNDKALQSHFLELMKAAFEQGTVPGKRYAYLVDRQSLAQGKPQIYGTQGRCTGSGDTATAEALTLDDPAHVDARREAAGLGPLQMYLDSLARHCRGGK